MKILRSISFALMGSIILLLIAGSITEQVAGTDMAVKYIYTAPYTIALWVAAVISGIIYLFHTKVYKQIITCLLHLSFVIILGGALITHLFGEQGQIHLRLNDQQNTQETNSNYHNPHSSIRNIRLLSFHINYYSGTSAPMDYVSEIEINGVKGQVSMNRIFTYRHHRFYQAMYDTDMQGVTLRTSYDPYGIAVTYTGYALLLLSIILFFFQKRTYFRTLVTQLKSSARQLVLLLIILLIGQTVPANSTNKQGAPPTLSQPTAEALCNLYVYYNDRVCPLQTLAHNFTIKIYGKDTYKGLTAEQVFSGWLFYYDRWAKEQCIKIKGKNIRQMLGIEGKYACLNDFTKGGVYHLEDALRQGDKNAIAADEKFQLISMVCTASIIKIFPLVPKDFFAPGKENIPIWYSLVDQLPSDTRKEDWQFVYGSMDYVSLCIARNANKEAQEVLSNIRTWQIEHAGISNLPSDAHFKVEKFYNTYNFTRPLAMIFISLGLLLFFFACILTAHGKQLNKYLNIALIILISILLFYLTTILIIRWIISGHVPLSNGYETMQFLSWISALFTIVGSVVWRKSDYSDFLLPFGYLLCGVTLMVSMMSGANPQITNLMPVLQSPWLTLHVSIIMIAYCLLAFIMLNSVVALIVRSFEQQERLKIINQVLLYPAVFCLAIGIFIGAVWANQSWGRYWGWDPKEVWALITMMVYAALFHTSSLRFLQRHIVFHLYCIVAFLFVLFTYFGVNFILGGMHSYA